MIFNVMEVVRRQLHWAVADGNSEIRFLTINGNIATLSVGFTVSEKWDNKFQL